jgi:hypothetical protein
MRFGRLECCRDADVDAALPQLSCRVLAEPLGDLRENLRCRVDEDPALPHSLERRIEAQRIADEIRELGECLDPRIPGPDEHEAEMALRVLGARGGRELELLQDVVSDPDRVGEALEAQCVLGQARNGKRSGDRAECDYELLVVHVDIACGSRNGDDLAVLVEREGAAE